MALLLLYMSLALLFSFVCSIMEAVLLTVSPAYVVSLEQQGRSSGRLLRHLKDDVDRPLAAILSLNTIAHTIGAAGAGAQAAVVFGSTSVGIFSAILTLLILIFSEIIPKTLGALYWRQLAPAMARGLQVLMVVMYPLVWLSERITGLLSRGDRPKALSHEELTALAELGAREGLVGGKESRILRNLFRFRRLTVEDVMTPRTVVFTLPQDLRVGEAVWHHPDVPFSRIPVTGDDRDQITGFVLKATILQAHAQNQTERPLREICRPLQAIPLTASLSAALDQLLNLREHIALVVDEYGDITGIVTLEDIVETLLGLEIVDEADTTVDMQALARAQWARRAQALGLRIEEFPQSDRTPDSGSEQDDS